ncbi:hypothetical protein CB1_064113016 [Camelus ferus]|nr:hypothetical protein CB1_064113016 [Camelus ferus]
MLEAGGCPLVCGLDLGLSHPEVEDHVAFLITVPTALAIFFAIFILVCIESVFKKLLRLFSLVIWICLVAMGYLFMCFGGTVSPWDQRSARPGPCGWHLHGAVIRQLNGMQHNVTYFEIVQQTLEEVMERVYT